MNSILIIIKREYLSRVRRKSFLISTILMPFIFVGLMALPAIVAAFAEPEDKHIAIIDDTGYISEAFLNEPSMTFEVSDKTLEELKTRSDLDAILYIPRDVVDNPGDVVMYTVDAPAPQTQAYISGILKMTIEQEKLARHAIPDLDRIISEINTDVNIRTVRFDEEGNEKETSGFGSYMVGILLTFVLYMFIMLYGQMVMTSIIEEKNNRVLELIVSSVKPTHLMLGKIFGIGAVALTQILIWAIIIIGFTVTLMPTLISRALVSGADIELTQILTSIGDPAFIIQLFGMMTVYLVTGYLFYSAIYAAIGSAVDNIQDASQLQIFALVPVILSMVFAMNVLNDPGSQFALWLSIIPFTSPIVMMARLPFGVPTWEIIVSLTVLVISLLGLIYLSAKIYRVGIFMYGKKPTIKDLIRWTRYK